MRALSLDFGVVQQDFCVSIATCAEVCQFIFLQPLVLIVAQVVAGPTTFAYVGVWTSSVPRHVKIMIYVWFSTKDRHYPPPVFAVNLPVELSWLGRDQHSVSIQVSKFVIRNLVNEPIHIFNQQSPVEFNQPLTLRCVPSSHAVDVVFDPWNWVVDREMLVQYVTPCPQLRCNSFLECVRNLNSTHRHQEL